MMELEFPRGSEWRKWDLHVHTPYSYLNNGFGSDFEEYAKRLLRLAIEKNVAAIGVTDYFFIKGYKRLKELVNDNKRLQRLVGEEMAVKAQRILLLPNIEFRTSTIVKGPDGKDKRVEIHVIFSDEVDPDKIERYFLGELRFSAESNPGDADEPWPLIEESLEDLGRRLKDEHEPFRDRSDLTIGMMNAVVRHEDITRVLEEKRSWFKDRYLIVIPEPVKSDWDGQGHLVRKLPMQKAHMIFSGNPNTRAFGLGTMHASPQEFIKEFKSLKPCIHGSDAHNYEKLFEPDLNRYTWIKADPTFLGLRYLLHEPESRVYIGNTPPSITWVEQNSTKYMKKIQFGRTQQAKETERWFNGEMLLNDGLIAIIGNKGGGKSALADILALLGNTRAGKYFAFRVPRRLKAC